MNDTELNHVLRSAPAPARSEEYWNEFSDRVGHALNRPLPSEPRSVNWWPRLAWAGGFGAACVLAGLLIGQHLGQSRTADANVLQNAKVVREVMSMFPNRVRAIVKDDAGIQLVLSNDANVPASTPLWVKICQGNRCTTLVTFSGQEVEVAGQKLTVLADANDGILLVGDRFAWASEESSSSVQDLKIQARPIEIASR